LENRIDMLKGSFSRIIAERFLLSWTAQESSIWRIVATNSFQTIELASHGYVVVAVEHPGTALLTTYADGTYEVFTDTSSHLPMEYQVQNEATIPIIKEQTKDIVFVLEQMKRMGEENANSPLIGNFDFARLGVIGHSKP